MSSGLSKLVLVLALVVAAISLALVYRVTMCGCMGGGGQQAATKQIEKEVLIPLAVYDEQKLIDAAVEKVITQTAVKLQERINSFDAQQAAAAPAQPAPQPEAAPAPEPAPAPAPRQPMPGQIDENNMPEGLPPVPAGVLKTEMGDMPAVGPENALVYVYIISDFQCPVCRRAANGLATFIRDGNPDVRWIFWNNPLEMHSRARLAAKAAMAAFRQGKFWEYHDRLFADQSMMSEQDLQDHARALGLDMEKFNKDIADPAMDVLMDAGMRVATLLDARGTPSFVVNGRKQVGWGSAGGIKSMVDQELAATKALVEAGKTPAQARLERGKQNSENEAQAKAYLEYMLAGKLPPKE